ncbi:DUF5999 family protein [Lentzea sp. NPDC005914]|uniref:DUF5999 family protein n=1 Tax=Lentzea sp. NPDC005914 TaxID=3154572 RepID=UPI0033C36D89
MPSRLSPTWPGTRRPVRHRSPDHQERQPCASTSHSAPSRRTRGPWAEIAVSHPEQGWYLLCNGIVLFDDGGLMLPGHRVVAPAA